MKKMILLLAMVSGLFMVGEARTEGAWILWENFCTNGERECWKIESAYPNFSLCSSEIKRAYEEACKFHQPKNMPFNYCDSSTAGVTIMINGKIILNAAWKCLPDTVDPRK